MAGHLDVGVAREHVHQRAVFALQLQLARRNHLASGEHVLHVRPHIVAHGRRDDEVEQVAAQGFFGRVAVQLLGRLVPVAGGAVLQVALHRDGRDVAQQRAKAQLGLAQRTFCLLALGDVAGQKHHSRLVAHLHAQGLGAPLKLAQP